MKIVVIGSGAAGAASALKARRLDEKAEIKIFDSSSYVLFANCGLPYHIGRVIEKRKELFTLPPQVFEKRFNIKLNLRCEVTAIDRQNKIIEVKDLEKEIYFKENYDRLILATGSSPIIPPSEGIKLKNIFTLWSIPAMDEIIKAIDEGAKRALIVGGGFLGLEVSESLVNRGLKVTLVDILPQVMPSLDPEITRPIIKELERMGVNVRLQTKIVSFGGEGKVEYALTEKGDRIDCDLVIMAVGVRPNIDLAKKCGLEVGPAGGIKVDKKMFTNDPSILAVGDIVEIPHIISGKMIRNPLAGPAHKEARIAGANAVGLEMEFKGTLATSIVKVGNIVAARSGLNEREAKEAGFEYFCVDGTFFSHTEYYPGAQQIFLKLIADKKTGRLLGAQAVGGKGVDKRIDVLATAMYAGLTIEDLENLDLAYAPPFSTPKDAVNTIGMIASNIFRGNLEQISVTELKSLIAAGKKPKIIDLRTSKEFEKEHIEKAISIPLEEMRTRLYELNPEEEYFLFCLSGYRSYHAFLILKQNGFKKIKNIAGGYRSWKALT
jgi:NADPH-dependent 2,4-dienoyl-CoA reductase/sulfur reductase-like enzyme/rhodanese-related sulfurtransferase